MRTSIPISVGLAFLTLFAVHCSQPGSNSSGARSNGVQTASPSPEAAASPASTPPGPPPSSQVKSLPPEGGDVPRPAEFSGYPYTYKKDATKTVATFLPKLLPPENLSGAVRDIIARSYGDKVDSVPRLTGSGPARSMRIAGKGHEYVIVPVTDESGSIRAIIITQMDE